MDVDQHSWREILSHKVKTEMQEFLNTMFPAVIVSVKDYTSKQMVDVKPLIHPEDLDGEVLDTPIIYSVPIQFPSAGGGLLSFPVKVGDTVAILISQRDISDWVLGDGSPKASKDIDNFDITHAIAIPGLYTSQTNLKPDPTNVELKFAGSSVKLTSDGSITANAPSSISATAPNISISGNVSISGSLSVNGVDVGDTHTHSGVETGGGNTGAPN